MLIYNLLIKPIELIVETIFAIGYRYSHNPGIAIVCVSLVVNLLVLPLYKKSDALQEKERKKQAEMEHWITHIKKTFKGDERYMMLSTYYRQVDYKPIQAIRGSFSLLLQIPFFIAAYHFLSNLNLLHGISFLGIKDLGLPDGMIVIGTISINLLPILMTAINFVSGMIYTKGFPLKDKLQLYIVALAFLVLLYKSPSGLVMYWTLNNLFSLGKNIVMKLWAKRGNGKEAKQVDALKTVDTKEGKYPLSLYVLGAAFLTMLLGLVIPVSVVSSAPPDFVSATNGPMQLVLSTVFIYAGFFLVWMSIFYYMATPKIRDFFAIGVWIASGVSLLDYFVFEKDFGVISTSLVYNNGLDYTSMEKLVNLVAVTVAVVILWLVIHRWPKFVSAAYMVLIISSVALSAVGLIKTQSEISKCSYYELHGRTDYEKIIPMSKNGKNVAVIMLDRAVGGYTPYALAQDEELMRQFDGFVYYPNTMSYGKVTHFAASALFGGYEYTPKAMNARYDERLVDKHNEALQMMPVLFSQNGYDVTVCDPPLVNYSNSWDISIFDIYDKINAYITIGPFVESITAQFGDYFDKIQEHNFVGYSLVRVAPLKLQKFLYDSGDYLMGDKAAVISSTFMSNYAALAALPKITDINDSSVGAFLMLQNSTSHEPTVLQRPEYEPQLYIDNRDQSVQRFAPEMEPLTVDTELEESHFDVNVLSYKALGDWFDYLRENGVYDNTRIIIVSDHSAELNQFPNMHFKNGFSFEAFNPVLMVKDFDAKGFYVDDMFMTNADVPTLAVEGVIDDAKNPFTGKAINNDEKTAHPQVLMTSEDWDYVSDSGSLFTNEDGEWWSVHDNVFDMDNWKKEE